MISSLIRPFLPASSRASSSDSLPALGDDGPGNKLAGSGPEVVPGSGVLATADSRRRRGRPSVLLPVYLDGNGATRLPRLFHSAGFHVALLCNAGLAAGASRHVDEWIPVTGGTADSVAQALLARLDEFAMRFDFVLPGDEPLLVAIQHCDCADTLASRLPFFPDAARLTVYLDNVRYLLEAREAGAPIPEFAVCKSSWEAQSAAQCLGFPVIVKQAMSMAGSGVKLAGSEEELNGLFKDRSGVRPFLVQRYVKGWVGATTLLLDHGKPVRWFSFYKLFNWPNAFSPCGGGEMMSDPQVDRLIEILAPLHGFHGLCGIDWIEEEATGRISVLEFNPRYTPTAYQGARVGADFAAAFRDWVDGRIPEPRRGDGRRRTFTMFPEATCRAIDDRNSKLLLKSLADAPYSDPRLLLAQLRRLAWLYLPSKRSACGRAVETAGAGMTPRRD